LGNFEELTILKSVKGIDDPADLHDFDYHSDDVTQAPTMVSALLNLKIKNLKNLVVRSFQTFCFNEEQTRRFSGNF